MYEDDFILKITDLNVKFFQDEGIINAVNGVNLKINEGKSIGIIGESGCGKSVTAYSILRLLPSTGKIISGEINYKMRDGKVCDLSKINPNSEEMRNIRGGEISLIFQEPMTAFSPVHKIGDQICEAILLHQKINKRAARERALELLRLVGISNPSTRLDTYSFQLSGGMCQRAMIAMALSSNPRLLIADEPTTAVDVTIQAQVLRLIKDVQRDFNLSLIMITHNLGVIAHMVDYVYVMYLGQVVEAGPVFEIFDNPIHPYTRGLLKSIPKLRNDEGRLASIKGSVPDAYHLPTGCFFHSRCQSIVGEACFKQLPETKELIPNHYVRCHLYAKGEVRENDKTYK
jgi:peptide/nickel transport system ATP-binding protein